MGLLEMLAQGLGQPTAPQLDILWRMLQWPGGEESQNFLPCIMIFQEICLIHYEKPNHSSLALLFLDL